MALLDTAIRTFATLDTREQVVVLRRVGLETECADMMLGHLRGMHPERFQALAATFGDDLAEVNA